jgi:hypothetical protein
VQARALLDRCRLRHRAGARDLGAATAPAKSLPRRRKNAAPADHNPRQRC